MPSNDWKGKKVLITGGLGFIGSNLARRCLESGAEVTIYDCLVTNSGGNLYNIEDVKSGLQWENGDILDFDGLNRHVRGKDFIFNCAGSTSHPFSMREPWMDLDANCKGVINLLEAVRRSNKEAKFIQMGTSTQLGKLRYQPADENHPEFPQDIYSANKSVAEKYVLIYANAHGLRATVARLSNVFGPRASIHSPDFTFNNYFVGLALQNKEITVYGDGAQKRNMIYVDDVVSALLQLAGTEQSNAQTYLLCGDEHYSVAEIAEATVKYLGSGKVKMIPWPAERKALDVGDAVLSNQKIKEATGWSPEYNLEKGFREIKSYYAQCLKHYLG